MADDNIILENEINNAFRTGDSLPNKSFTTMAYPLYLPDLTGCYLWLLPNLKNATRRPGFTNITDIQTNMTYILKVKVATDSQK